MVRPKFQGHPPTKKKTDIPGDDSRNPTSSKNKKTKHINNKPKIKDQKNKLPAQSAKHDHIFSVDFVFLIHGLGVLMMAPSPSQSEES